jgi:hypothetical protein
MKPRVNRWSSSLHWPLFGWLAERRGRLRLLPPLQPSALKDHELPSASEVASDAVSVVGRLCSTRSAAKTA